MNTPHNPFPQRIYSLDVLRGIAALAVVFWHWQHFFYVGDSPRDFNGVGQPLFNLFTLAYQRGSLAVELFFCISGFVFFWLFSQKIADRTLTASAFFMDRFSRLYPLHLVTFIAVAALQMAYASSHTTYFVYQQNDLYHAFLNLLLIPAWGFETGWSFNAPIWSVSVEVLLYAMLFALCLTRQARYLIIPCLIALGYYLYPGHYKLGSGIFTFFCGGVAFIIMNRLMKQIGIKAFLLVAALMASAAWSFVMLSKTLNLYFLMGVAFPTLVMLLAAISCAFPTFLRPLAAVGDISYSSYLLHFPLQIIFAMIVDSLGGERNLFYSPWMLALFMAVLIPLSYGCHRLFEVPVQRALRRAFGKSPACRTTTP
ncbi:acyltransferase [Pseudomonas sp. CDFA 602]|uniref:acyltransferase family protein n=1 Tax=Pseudomonas californiensis TaxID=2829823 RepID=UPI001E2D6259|nr:acyltransferase [Pseudomonas californiensis]MCD5995591.1 acyltransferase [Pseudomonas californiensis]MCD6001185.1 acyltransferase [Pseudomonas californiensis]